MGLCHNESKLHVEEEELDERHRYDKAYRRRCSFRLRARAREKERERERERERKRERGREREPQFDLDLSLSLSLARSLALGRKLWRRWYALVAFDHVPVVEDLAQVEAKINNLVSSAPRVRIQL